MSTNANEEPVDRQVELERLAGLNVIDYEAARAKSAARLGVRAAVLDKEVSKKRRALGVTDDDDDRQQGRAVTLPWPEPVDGDQLLTEVAAAVKPTLLFPIMQPSPLRCGYCTHGR